MDKFGVVRDDISPKPKDDQAVDMALDVDDPNVKRLVKTSQVVDELVNVVSKTQNRNG